MWYTIQTCREAIFKDLWQITFVTWPIMFNRFCLFSKPPTPTLSLLVRDKTKLDGMNTNQDWMKNTCLLYIVFQVLRRKYLCEKLWDRVTSSFISCFTSAFLLADLNLYKFLLFTNFTNYFLFLLNMYKLHLVQTFFNIYMEKNFPHKFSFFKWFTPHPLYGQNPCAKCDKSCLSIMTLDIRWLLVTKIYF